MAFHTKPDWSYQPLPVFLEYSAPTSKYLSHVASAPPKSLATSSRSVGRPASLKSLVL